MKRFVLLLALAALAACSQKAAPPQAQNEPAPPAAAAAPAEPAGEPSRIAALAPDVPAGEYKMDHAHSTLIFAETTSAVNGTAKGKAVGQIDWAYKGNGALR